MVKSKQNLSLNTTRTEIVIFHAKNRITKNLNF